MSAVKIGILTFHRCINYGSYWQARCLVAGLRARGHEVVILDHDSPRVNVAEWKCALRPTLPAATLRSDYPGYRKKIRRFFRAIELLPRSARFSLDDPIDTACFDVVVVGSDEVWNPVHPWYGRTALFYGDRIRAPRLVSYAASFGNHDASAGLQPVWAERLRTFALISVRDDSSRAIVGDAIGVEPEIVLDPCLQFPVAPDEHDGDPSQGRYAAVYGHGFSESLVEEVGRWARRRNLPLVSVGYRNAWADRQWITAGPHEFARCIAQSEAVVTNFFHGCVFALRYRKPFVCEDSWYRGNKLRSLMARIGGEPHLLAYGTSAAACDRLLSEPLDPVIPDRIDDLRRRSERYLDRALASPLS